MILDPTIRDIGMPPVWNRKELTVDGAIYISITVFVLVFKAYSSDEWLDMQTNTTEPYNNKIAHLLLDGTVYNLATGAVTYLALNIIEKAARAVA